MRAELWRSRLRELEQAYLHMNSLTGSVPERLGEISGLAELRLNQNRLNGTLPASLGLPKLRSLLLSSNNFSGYFTRPLFGIDSLCSRCLEILDLGNNANLQQWGPRDRIPGSR